MASIVYGTYIHKRFRSTQAVNRLRITLRRYGNIPRYDGFLTRVMLMGFMPGFTACSVFATYYYQPMAGLQDPTSRRFTDSDLKGVDLILSCVSEKEPDSLFVNPKTGTKFNNEYRRDFELPSPQKAQQICDKISEVLKQLGAKVELADDSDKENPSNKPTPTNLSSASISVKRLQVEIASFHRSQSVHWTLFPLMGASFSFFPVESESDIWISLKVTSTSGTIVRKKDYLAKFQRVISPIYAGINLFMNLAIREPAEKISIPQLHSRFSYDLYRQILFELQNAAAEVAVENLPTGVP